MPAEVSTWAAKTRSGFSASIQATTSSTGGGAQAARTPWDSGSCGRAVRTAAEAGIPPISKIWVQRKLNHPFRITRQRFCVANCRATASMAAVPPPGTRATERAPYTCLSEAEMSRITSWKACDMWLSERSVKTTEYSSRPSGSTWGSKPGTSFSCLKAAGKLRGRAGMRGEGWDARYSAPKLDGAGDVGKRNGADPVPPLTVSRTVTMVGRRPAATWLSTGRHPAPTPPSSLTPGSPMHLPRAFRLLAFSLLALPLVACGPGGMELDPEAAVDDMIPAPRNVDAPPARAEQSASGLAWVVLEEGDGERSPTTADMVRVHYTGWQTDGTMFDSSVVRGEPADFPAGGLISGWVEGLQLMTEGEIRRFWIPADLAYGDPASRPGAPAGMLVFDVQLIEILTGGGEEPTG